MAVQVRSLTVGSPTIDNSLAAPNDNLNVVPTANTVYDLYIARSDSTNNIYKTAVISNIRLVNTSLASAVTINLYFMRLNSMGQNRRRLISPVNLSLAAGLMYVDDDEITLEPGDRIQCMVSLGGVVHYLINGVERDQ
jgi:hypothetical protein